MKSTSYKVHKALDTASYYDECFQLKVLEQMVFCLAVIADQLAEMNGYVLIDGEEVEES